MKLQPRGSSRCAASTTGAIGVAQPDGTVAHAVLDVLVAVDVPDAAALARAR